MVDTTATAVAPAGTTTTSNRKTALADTIRQSFTGDAPLTDKFKALYKARPVATVGLAAVAGLALLGTLRGR